MAEIAGVIAGGCLLLVLVAALKKQRIEDQYAQVKDGDIGLIKNLGKSIVH